MIADTIKGEGKRILPLFRDYLRFGYYPYFLEHREQIEEFHLKLEQDVRKTVINDSIAVYPNLNGSSIKKILKLLSLLTESVPYTPDLNDLKRKLDIGDIRTLKHYLKFLEDGNVILSFSKKGKGFNELEKPAKLYLNNTNLIYALGDNEKVDRGNMRETFFSNIVSSCYTLNIAHKEDFLVDDRYIF